MSLRFANMFLLCPRPAQGRVEETDRALPILTELWSHHTAHPDRPNCHLKQRTETRPEWSCAMIQWPSSSGWYNINYIWRPECGCVCLPTTWVPFSCMFWRPICLLHFVLMSSGERNFSKISPFSPSSLTLLTLFCFKRFTVMAMNAYTLETLEASH